MGAHKFNGSAYLVFLVGKAFVSAMCTVSVYNQPWIRAIKVVRGLPKLKVVH